MTRDKRQMISALPRTNDERDSNANVNERGQPKLETGAIATTRHERSEYPSAKLPDTAGTRNERSESGVTVVTEMGEGEN
ncbi:MAG: hypothetical protein ACOVMR_08820 [Flavobacteriales bacterium]